MIRLCKTSGEPLVRRASEMPHQLAKRLTCGGTCTSKARIAMMLVKAPVPAAERPRCVICRTAPCAVDVRNRNYVHCGTAECRKASIRGDHVRGHGAATGWPERSKVVVLDFAPHEVSPPAEAMFRGARPANRSLTGSSAAWAAGV